MCYAPFFVATSSLTGRGSKRASKKEGAGWAGTGGGGRGVPVFVPCPQPGVIRAWKIGAWTVSTSLAPFSTRMLKDEKRLKNEVGVHENIRALGAPVGGEEERRNTEERLFNILLQEVENYFFPLLFLFFSFSLTQAGLSDGWTGTASPARHTPYPGAQSTRRRYKIEKFSTRLLTAPR